MTSAGELRCKGDVHSLSMNRRRKTFEILICSTIRGRWFISVEYELAHASVPTQLINNGVSSLLLSIDRKEIEKKKSKWKKDRTYIREKFEATPTCCHFVSHRATTTRSILSRYFSLLFTYINTFPITSSFSLIYKSY